MKTIIIDSADKVNGSNTNFTINLTQPIVNPRKATLLFSSMPTAEDNTLSYFLVRIQEFGVSVQNGNNQASTFVIPVSSSAGFRSLHQVGNDFELTANANMITLNQLNVQVIDRTGQIAEDSGEVLLIVQID